MKILELTFHLQSGGAERFVVDLSNELAKTNDVTLLTLRDDTVTCVDRNFYRNEISSRVKYSCLGLPNGLRPSMWYRIWRYIRKEHPDIVHFHGDTMCYYIFVPILFSTSKIKFVQTIHLDLHYGGYDRGLNKCVARLLGPSRRIRYAALAQKNYDDLVRCYPNVLSACIVNGRAEIKPTSAFNDVKHEVDLYKTSQCTKILLHVARCSEQKNQKRLVEAFNTLVSNGEDVQLLVIGEGFDKPLGLQVRALACDRVHFLGPKKNVVDYLLCSDLFCLSSDAEGMPISILEALLSGTPVVSTPVCGALDAIKDGENGILAKGYETQDYAGALNTALSSLEVLKSHADASKDSSPYTIKVCAEKYLKFFKE